MANKLVKILLERYKQAQSTRATYEDTLMELGKYVWPQMQDIVHSEKNDKDEEVRTVYIYDTTAITASQRMATGIQGNLMPVGVKMFEFAAEDDILNAEPEIKAELSRATSAVHKILWQSNFFGQVANLIRSLVVFTLGVISMETLNGKRVFKTYHIRDVFFERNFLGEVDTVFRRIFYTKRQARQAYPGKDLGKVVEADDKGTDNHEFVHIVYPNADYDKHKVGSKKFASLVIQVKDKTIVEEGGFSSLPYRVVQYGENLDGDMGYGPSVEMLPDIKMVNAMQKSDIIVTEKVADPPMIVEDDGIVGQPVTSPGGLIIIRSGAKPPLPWESRAQLQPLDIKIQRVQQNIREAFLNDVFDALKFYRRETRAELKEAEILGRVEEGFVVLAPVVAAIQRDLLDPLILDVLNSLSKDELDDFNLDFEKKIVYQGRLALAMSSMETNAIETILAKWAVYDEAYQVFDNVDMDEAFKVSALNTGVPAAVLKDIDEVDEMRQGRNEEAQARAQAEIAADASVAFKNVAGAV